MCACVLDSNKNMNVYQWYETLKKLDIVPLLTFNTAPIKF